MALTDREKEQLKALIDADEPLPLRYKAELFTHTQQVELVWPGKTTEVTSVVLPFQSIEQIDEPRSEHNRHVADLFAFDANTGRQSGGWTNKLIWGDKKLVLSSLKNGPLRRQIEDAGGLKLVYIDPPFDVGADFSFEIGIGAGDKLTKAPSVIEDIAYRDTWGRGIDSYASMIFERLILVRNLLHDDASIYVHCDWRVSGLVRQCMDEIFGYESNIGCVVWRRTNARGTTTKWPRIHDYIFHYSKNKRFTFHAETVVADLDKMPHTLITGTDGIKYQTYELTAPGRTEAGESGRPWRDFDPGKFGRHWANAQTVRDEWDRAGLIHWPDKQGLS